MHKSKLFILAAIALVMAGFTLQSCEDEDSYGERRERERKVIRSFINKGTLIKALDSDDTLIYVAPIKTISEAQFEAQDSTTNLQENEYVLFKSSGVYMQIVRKGAGEKLKNGADIARYAWELASDIVSFEANIMKYFESCLKVLGVENADVQRELENLATFEPVLREKKPENAEDPVEVSLDFTDPKVIKLFNGCANGQAVSMPLCTVCRGRATWFAMPCSHPMYCDADKELEEGLEEFCCNDGCNAKIERLVRIED